MIIRPAQEEDVAPILAFWNPIIRDTTISFANDEHDPNSLLSLILSRRAQGTEFLVACDNDQVLGLATYSQFRSNTGYRRTVEHTIILAPEARGRGFALEAARCTLGFATGERGMQRVLAIVQADNQPSRGLLEKLGMNFAGIIQFGGRDTCLYQLDAGASGAA